MSAHQKIFKALGLDSSTEGNLASHSPIDGALLGSVQQHKPGDIEKIAKQAQAAFHAWREVPAPVRGEFVRILGEELRASKEDLGALVTMESGKIVSEGLGEVQEMIDICDYAVGLSRQLFGLTIASERPGHHMREMWQPLGPVGIISAFNFPVAVWMWNAALALVCGNSLVWKPSEKTPLTAAACQNLFERAAEKFRKSTGRAVPPYLSQLFIGQRDVGEALAAHKSFPLISATGSVRMGRAVGEVVARRMGRSLLELGGNNAMIVTDSADLDMALRSILFGAVGTCGQRCTSTRRLIVHEKVYDQLIPKLVKAYGQVRIGNPLKSTTLVGPLIDRMAFESMEKALDTAKKAGGRILVGGGRAAGNGLEGGYYVHPAIVEMAKQSEVMHEETFAPILYIVKYKILDDAIAIQNDVPQGLSSCIFTTDVRESELFLSAVGSDCGIANVNLGTSGAEIGGAFGGEKETGGGRESGSTSWQAYMRRQTQTINYSRELPLAQGVRFDL
ncbi:MAG: L-piperidine-6-carboxylate dehydrogenase [Alphaproteobacteria bacterium]